MQECIGNELPDVWPDWSEHELLGPDAKSNDSLPCLGVYRGSNREDKDYDVDKYEQVVGIWCSSWANTCSNRYHIKIKLFQVLFE